MKKTLSLLLFLALSVSLTACTKPVEVPNPDDKKIVEVEVPTADYIGLPVEEAQSLAAERGLPFRVVEEDGTPLVVTMDFVPGRINAAVELGKVIFWEMEGGEKPKNDKPQYDAESWKTMIPADCESYFDGCNNCRRLEGSEVGACTRKACFEYQEPKCLDEAPAETATLDNYYMNDDFRVKPISHATMILDWSGKTIITDPVGQYQQLKNLQSVDIALVTDIHGDHLDTETLRALSAAIKTLVVPQAVYDELPELLQVKAEVLANGESKYLDGVTVTAVPMYNLPESDDSRHVKGQGNGYVLEMNGKRVYISGDTADIEEMRSLENIDIAFVCMNEPYTMSPISAASAVLDFAPKIVFPYHYRQPDGLADVDQFADIVREGNGDIEIIQLDWYIND